MSPYDDGWLLGSLHELAVEIALNHPSTVSIARPMTNLALVCSGCRVVLKRCSIISGAPPPPPELAIDHTDGRGELVVRFGIAMTPDCEGGGRLALWCPIKRS